MGRRKPQLHPVELAQGDMQAPGWRVWLEEQRRPAKTTDLRPGGAPLPVHLPRGNYPTLETSSASPPLVFSKVRRKVAYNYLKR